MIQDERKRKIIEEPWLYADNIRCNHPYRCELKKFSIAQCSEIDKKKSIKTKLHQVFRNGIKKTQWKMLIESKAVKGCHRN